MASFGYSSAFDAKYSTTGKPFSSSSPSNMRAQTFSISPYLSLNTFSYKELVSIKNHYH
jgi:hypothetical protein